MHPALRLARRPAPAPRGVRSAVHPVCVASDFYATSAQVIPILYLAIVFEQRIWDNKEPATYFGIGTRQRTGRVPTAAGVLIVLLICHLFAGEAFALMAISGGGSATAHYVITGALIIGGLVVVLPTLMLGVAPLVPEALATRNIMWDLELGGFLIQALCVAALIHTGMAIAIAIF